MEGTTDLARHLSAFISGYLPEVRGARRNTIMAYRDTFVLFLGYLERAKGIPLTKLTLSMVDRDTVLGFLGWLQSERGCSTSSRNARLAAVRSFYSYLQYREPGLLDTCLSILSIPVKTGTGKTIGYLSLEAVKLLLALPDQGTKRGRRDLALLALMYDTGSRVQELLDLRPSMLHLDGRTPTVRIHGKGGRARLVPMLDAQTVHLKRYMAENRLDLPRNRDGPLFFNSGRQAMTRAGIAYILKKYVSMARKKGAGDLFPIRVSCHTLRHSKAMHLLRAGVNLIYIRDLLGHASVRTTEIYARADSLQKRKALEAGYTNVSPEEPPIWEGNDGLIGWLKSF